MIREARPTDMAEIMKVMEAAKGIMRSSGNMHQWTDGYPSEAVILSDMEKKAALSLRTKEKLSVTSLSYLHQNPHIAKSMRGTG